MNLDTIFTGSDLNPSGFLRPVGQSRNRRAATQPKETFRRAAGASVFPLVVGWCAALVTLPIAAEVGAVRGEHAPWVDWDTGETGDELLETDPLDTPSAVAAPSRPEAPEAVEDRPRFDLRLAMDVAWEQAERSYRARGIDPDDALTKAGEVIRAMRGVEPSSEPPPDGTV